MPVAEPAHRPNNNRPPATTTLLLFTFMADIGKTHLWTGHDEGGPADWSQ